MHVESFVCIVAWRNGTRCRDGVKILWHHCHPFVQKTFFLRLVLFSFVCLFVLFFRNGKQRRWERGAQGEDAWSIKYERIELVKVKL